MIFATGTTVLILIIIQLKQNKAQQQQNTQSCVRYNPIVNQCGACGPNFYLNQTTEIKRFFDSSECLQRNTSGNIKSVFISNEPCKLGDLCNGTKESPYDSIVFSLINESIKSNAYKESRLEFLLLGSPHFALQKDVISKLSTIKLFWQMKVNISISPYYCSMGWIRGCFQENEQPVLYIKFDFMYIYVTSELIINNINFKGNDIHLLNDNKILMDQCYNKATECCNEEMISRPFHPDYNPCGMLNRQINFANYKSWKSYSGFVTIESQMKSDFIPVVNITNCSFENWYSIIPQNNSISLILMSAQSNGDINIRNTTFKNIRLFKGVFFMDDIITLYPPFDSDLLTQARFSSINFIDSRIEEYNLYDAVHEGSDKMTLFDFRGSEILSVSFKMLSISKINLKFSFLNVLKLFEVKNFEIDFFSIKNCSRIQFFESYLGDIIINNIVVQNIYSYLDDLFITSYNNIEINNCIFENLISETLNGTILTSSLNTDELTYLHFLVKISNIQIINISNFNFKIRKLDFILESILVYDSTYSQKSIELDNCLYISFSNFTLVRINGGSPLFYITSNENYDNLTVLFSQGMINNCYIKGEFIFWPNGKENHFFTIKNVAFENCISSMIVSSKRVDSITIEDISYLQVSLDEVSKIFIKGLFSFDFITKIKMTNLSIINSTFQSTPFSSNNGDRSFSMKNLFLSNIYYLDSCFFINSEYGVYFRNIVMINISNPSQSKLIAKLINYDGLQILNFNNITIKLMNSSFLTLIKLKNIEKVTIFNAKFEYLDSFDEFAEAGYALIIISSYVFNLSAQNINVTNFKWHKSHIEMDYRHGFLSFFSSDSYLKEENLDSIELINITLINNRITPRGIIAVVNVFLLNISNLFIKNSISEQGGGLYISQIDNTMITNFTIENSSAIEGGCVYASNVNSLVIKFFSSVQAFGDRCGCLFLYFVSDIEINKIALLDSSSKENGGSIYLVNSFRVLINELISKNTSTLSEGGVIYSFRCNLTMIYVYASLFIAERGGFIFSEDGGIVNFTNGYLEKGYFKWQGLSFCLINNQGVEITNFSILNSLNSSGTGNIFILVDSQETELNRLTNIKSIYNSISNGTFVFFISKDHLIIANCSIFFNQGSTLFISSEDQALTLDSISKEVEIINLKIGSTTGLGSGQTFVGRNRKFNFKGDIHFYFSTPALVFENSDCLFNSLRMVNITTPQSQTILISVNSKILLKRLFIRQINYNISLLIASESEIIIENSLIINFITYEKALFILENSALTVYLTTIQNNQAFNSGGFHLSNTSSNFSTVFFNNNTKLSNIERPMTDFKEQDLTANDIVASNFFLLLINGCVFISSNVKSNAIYVQSGGIFSSSNSLFSSGRSMKGQGIIADDTNLLIQKCSFISLQAIIGSAIKIISIAEKFISVNITNSFFAFNVAILGSAIFSLGDMTINVNSVIFLNNTAVRNQNGIFGIAPCWVHISKSENSRLTMKGSSFLFNRAKNFAATVFSLTRIEEPSPEQVNGNFYYKNSDFLNFSDRPSYPPFSLKIKKILIPDMYYSYSNSTNIKINTYTDLYTQEIINGVAFSLEIDIVDGRDQILVFDSYSTARLSKSSADSGLKLTYANIKVNKGVCNFTEVKINSIQNISRNFTLNVSIRYDFQALFPGLDSIKLEGTIYRGFSFYSRPCILGEVLIEADNSCYLCPENQYSIIDPMNKENRNQKCFACPDNAICAGGILMAPKKGYWRSGVNSTMIIPCFSEYSCLGGGPFISIEDIKGKCADNQYGPLCYTCAKGFARLYSKGVCEPCSSSFLMYLKIFLAFVAIFIYITLQMQFIFKMNSKGYSGILIKQLINHFQQISTLSILELGWTEEIKNYFLMQEYFSFASEEFVSLDCLFDDIDGNLLVKRIIVSTIIPFVLTFLSLIGWKIIYSFKRIMKKEIPKEFLSSRYRASFIIIGYLLFPEILRKCFSFMNCIQIENISDTSVVLTSPNVVCWDNEHIKMLLYSSLPGVLVWGILAPLITWMYLKQHQSAILKKGFALKNRSLPKKIKTEQESIFGQEANSDNKNMKMVKRIDFKKKNYKNSQFFNVADQKRSEMLAYNMLNFFYKGYKAEFYYWEIIMFLKKILLILIASFTEFFPPGIKATLLLVILTVFTLLQTRKNPFESENLNRIEFYSLIVTFLTANVGIMLISEELRILSKFFLVFVITNNAWFFLIWLRSFVKVILRKKRGPVKIL